MAPAQRRMLEEAARNGWSKVGGPRWRTANVLVREGLAAWHYASTGVTLGITITPLGRAAIGVGYP